MNNIEKLAIDVMEECQNGTSVSNIMHILEQHFAKALQSSGPVAEPFGYWHQGETYEESEFHLNSESGDVSCEHCVKLYTLPPSTISLEEHNKRIAELEAELQSETKWASEYARKALALEATNKTLLDGLRYYADKNNWSRDSQELGMEVRYYNVLYGDMYEHNDVTKYGGMRAKQAIAGAEGVER